MGGIFSVRKEKKTHIQTFLSNEKQLHLTCQKCEKTWTLSEAKISKLIKDNSKTGYKNCDCGRSSISMKCLKKAKKDMSKGIQHRQTTENYTLEIVIQSGDKVSPEDGKSTRKKREGPSQGGSRVSPQERKWTQEQIKDLSQGGSRVSSKDGKRTQKQRKDPSQGGSSVSPVDGKRTQKQRKDPSQGGSSVSPVDGKRTQKQRKDPSQGDSMVSPEDGKQTQEQRNDPSQLFNVTDNIQAEEKEPESNVLHVQSSDLTLDSPERPDPSIHFVDQKHNQRQDTAYINSVKRQNFNKDHAFDTRTTVSQYWNRTVVNQESVHIKGIPNVGQSCYANAVLQILNQTLCDYNGNTVTSCRSSSNTITEVFENVLCEMNDQNMNVFHVQRNTVQELMQLFCQRDPSFILGQQNDCHSFMLSLLNMIKDEGKRSFFPMFEAQIKTVFRYEPCGHVEYSDNETCLSFLIPIKDKMKNWTVEKGLNHLLEKEVLPHKQLFCRECFPLDSKRVKENSKTTKQMIIVSSPEFLVLHLGRFLEGEGGKIVKIQVKVGYDAVLFLPVLREKSVRYELYAVVLHNGTINGGHYTSMIRKHGDVWFDCNDFTITRINKGQAYNNPNAYLLFYRKSRT